MQRAAKTQENNAFLAFLASLIYAGCVVFHLASAWAGYSNYRDLHLGTALEFAKGGVDFFHPIIVGFNATGTPTIQEFPLWQGLAGATFRLLGLWFGWANLLSLILFATGIWPLYALAKGQIGARGACWTVLFFITQPLLVFLSGQASADGLSFSLSLWFLYFAVRLVQTGRAIWWFPASLFGILSAVTKVPFYLCVALTSFLFLLMHTPRSVSRWLLLAGVGLASGGVFAAWTRYTNSWMAVAELPLVDLRVSSDSMMWFWFFGDWHYRLNPFNWGKGCWFALNSIFGSFALVALSGAALFHAGNKLGKLWIGAAFCSTLIFSHLVLAHRHYFVMYSPGVALLSAAAILHLENAFRFQSGSRRNIVSAAIALVLCLSAIQGLIGSEIVLDYDPYPHAIARIIDELTTPVDKLLIQGGGWGGEILFLAGRTGKSIDDPRLLDHDQTRERLLALGYTKLVMISESPLLNSLQQTNPGNLSRTRKLYKELLTPYAESLETAFQSDDILIKDLPRKSP